jgi:putative SOS response-associated peptidase YedK
LFALRQWRARLPGIFPDMMAPVIRNARDGERELTVMRWGFPPPSHAAANCSNTIPQRHALAAPLQCE